jgi:hypothetical protein
MGGSPVCLYLDDQRDLGNAISLFRFPPGVCRGTGVTCVHHDLHADPCALTRGSRSPGIGNLTVGARRDPLSIPVRDGEDVPATEIIRESNR